MSLTGGIDVVPPGLAVASCTVGPLGLALIVCVVLVWRLQSAEPVRRKRLTRIIAILTALIAASLFWAWWTDQRWHEEREQRFREREIMRDTSQPEPGHVKMDASAP
jgi:4-amino-4-deoxy-L-arabinose transferase-like glycosyltransferase